jgi:hypothetical protein
MNFVLRRHRDSLLVTAYAQQGAAANRRRPSVKLWQAFRYGPALLIQARVKAGERDFDAAFALIEKISPGVQALKLRNEYTRTDALLRFALERSICE